MFKQITLSLSLLLCLSCDAANPEKSTPRTKRKDSMSATLTKEEQVCRKTTEAKVSNSTVIPDINGGFSTKRLEGASATAVLAALLSTSYDPDSEY